MSLKRADLQRCPPLKRGAARLPSSLYLSVALTLMLAVRSLGAEPRTGGVRIDRAVVRFTAPETGGAEVPRFIFERLLAFEARIEALSDRAFDVTAASPYLPRHVRAAMERHIAETILESLDVSPAPSVAEIRERAAAAQLALNQRLGSSQSLGLAARAEGMDQTELYRFLQRRARASLYLDRMVTPMLEPSEAELQGLHQSGRSPFRGRTYEEIRPQLRRWHISRLLQGAVLSYYESARARLSIRILR